MLKVTVCEFHDEPAELEEDWDRLVLHVKAESSDVVLLPEMPFVSWFARSQHFDLATWQQAVSAHDAWQTRFEELAPAVILSSRPMNGNGCRLNEGFVWERASGYRAAHTKYYLPDEAGFWEAAWYERGDERFAPVDVGGLRIGFVICTELWFMERARAYGKAGIHLLVTPRATEPASLDKWLTGGRTAAVVAGAFGLSSNRVSAGTGPAEFGGQGWIVSPDGEVLGLTSRQHPFVTVEIDPSAAERAKTTYPRYVPD
jgi:predicted amidohydrolase